jgi:chromosome segregation ATPase
MKVFIRVIILAALGVVAILAVREYFTATNELSGVKNELSQEQYEVTRQRLAKEGLRREKDRLQGELTVAQQELQKIQTELDQTKQKLDEVNLKLTGVESANAQLLQEKQVLEEKLHSLKELKIALREARYEEYRKKLQQYLERKKLQEELDALKLAQGNRGFLLRDGQPQSQNYQGGIKIEVRPAP